MKDETKIKLPKDFLFGAASAAHQVEGNNTNSDWWYWEQAGKLPKSGSAADHYNRYEADFKLAQQIGLNLMRISIEWARIEPQEGKFSSLEIEHYRNVLKTLKFLGFKRMVTLWHWTLPKWFSDSGGFTKQGNLKKFVRYCKFVTVQLGEEIDYFITINEPEVYCFLAYQRGIFPPFAKGLWTYYRVLRNLIAGHKAVFAAIKQVKPDALIGFAKNAAYYEPYNKHSWIDALGVKVSRKFSDEYLLDRLKNHLDFIGLNYYFYSRLKFDVSRHGFVRVNQIEDDKLRVINEDVGHRSDLGWYIFPEGIYHLLLELKKYNKPVFVTENGLADSRDTLRKNFIRDHLYWIGRAIQEGMKVKGYCYWSLTDTYEWHDGYKYHFGLIKVNFFTQERTVRPSAGIIKEIKASL